MHSPRRSPGFRAFILAASPRWGCFGESNDRRILSNRTLDTMNASIPPRVLIFGEVLWDIFPDQSILGGAPFNVAVHLHRFGVPVAFVSRIGNDPLGQRARARMAQLGIGDQWVQQDATLPTGTVDVLFESGGHRFEIGAAHAYDAIGSPDNIDLAHIELMVFGTLARRAPESRRTARALMSGQEPCIRFTDLNLRSPWIDGDVIDESFRHSDIVKLNEEEAIIASRLTHSGAHEAPLEAAMALMERYRLHQLIVTQGGAGVTLIDTHGRTHECSARAIAGGSGDSVGAGDAFSAAYLFGTLQHWELSKTLDRAVRYASRICEVRGALPEEGAAARELLDPEPN